MRARGTRRTEVALLAGLLPVVGAACAGAGGPEAETSPRPTADTVATDPAGQQEVGTDPAGPERLRELETLYRARKDSARSRFTEADVRFMTGMIAHHAQALVMARMAPTHGAGPRIRTLAARIINAQKDEIATMQAWLRDRGQPVPEIEIRGTTLRIHGVGEGRADGGGHEAVGGHDPSGGDGAGGELLRMPGMLTPDELRELDGARGGRFDRLFLRFMIRHHAGAVTMVHELFGTDGAAQDEAAFRLASDIQVDQRTEIARMERMLESLPPGGGP